MHDVNASVFDMLMAILSIASVFITTRIVPWLRAHAGAQRLYLANNIASAAVRATEQTLGHLPGQQKFYKALAWARDLADAHGLNLSDSQWGALLETAVADMHSWHLDAVTPEPPVAPVAPIVVVAPPVAPVVPVAPEPVVAPDAPVAAPPA